MPSSATTNVQLNARSYFRGVFMCNTLLTSCACLNKSGIMHLDDAGLCAYWIAYVKRNNRVVYFDSFGNLQPPKELMRYFGNGVTTIEYK